MLFEPRYYYFLKRTGHDIYSLHLYHDKLKKFNASPNDKDSVLNLRSDIIANKYNVLKDGFYVDSLFQEWFCDNFTEFSYLVKDLDSGLKKKYSQVMLAGKFGLFGEF